MSTQSATPRKKPVLNGDTEEQTLTFHDCDNATTSSRHTPCAAAGWYPVVKPGIEFCLALFILVLSLPVILIAAVLVKLTSRGPVFYSQARIGKDGQPFTLYKIRSMFHECEKDSGPAWSSPGDPRVTPVGRFLRWSHIDELPQLWNVLRGQMSLVGPRPERPEFVPQLATLIPHYRKRLQVRPGITGLAQIQLPPDTNLDSVRRKLAHDLHYIQRVSFWLDMRLIIVTAVNLTGIPFRLTQAIFRIPGGEHVERSYETLAAKTKTNTKLQPA